MKDKNNKILSAYMKIKLYDHDEYLRRRAENKKYLSENKEALNKRNRERYKERQERKGLKCKSQRDREVIRLEKIEKDKRRKRRELNKKNRHIEKIKQIKPETK